LRGADEPGWTEPDLSSGAARTERLVPIFSHHWVGPDSSSPHRWRKSTSLAWINGLTFIALTVLQNRGRPDITGKPHLIEILPFLAILWTLTSTLGNLRGIAGWLFFGCPKWRAADYLGVAAGRLLAASEVAAHLFGGKLL